MPLTRAMHGSAAASGRQVTDQPTVNALASTPPAPGRDAESDVDWLAVAMRPDLGPPAPGRHAEPPAATEPLPRLSALELTAAALRIALVPDDSAEYQSLAAATEARTGRPLSESQQLRLLELVALRLRALERLERQRALHRAYEDAIARLQAERQQLIYYDAGVMQPPRPSFWRLFEQQFMTTGPGGIVKGAWANFKHIVARSEELRREAIARGDYRGAFFAPAIATAESGFESISDGLRQTSRAIEQLMEARSATERLIASVEATLGLGQAALGAWGMVEPLAGMSRGGPMRGPGLAAIEATASGASRAAAAIAAGESAAAGALSRPAIIMAVAGLDGILGDGPEIDAIHVRNRRIAGIAPDEGEGLTVRHHMLPQEHIEWFRERGFPGRDIDEFCIELEAHVHEAVHGGGSFKRARRFWPEGEWNTSLMQTLERAERAKQRKFGRKAKLSRDEVLFHAQLELAKFKLAGRPFVPYDPRKKRKVRQ